MVFFLTESERINILIYRGYGDRIRSYREVCELFNALNPDKQIKKSTVCRTIKRYQQTGNVKTLPKTGRPKTVATDDNKLNVLLSLEDNPKMSLAERKQFLPEDISKSSLHRILKQEKIKPYKLMYTQELLEDDPDRRCEFSEMMINKINNDPDFKNKILFSDESTFCLNGEVNRHNCRFWSKTNPHWMEPLHTQRPQKVNVWAGIVKDKIIGPFFIEGNLNSQKYLQILRGKVVPKLIELNINVNEIWFQQDGAPPHFARTVREFLDEVFPGRWIGRRGSIEWPARSPDLTPMDFFTGDI